MIFCSTAPSPVQSEHRWRDETLFIILQPQLKEKFDHLGNILHFVELSCVAWICLKIIKHKYSTNQAHSLTRYVYILFNFYTNTIIKTVFLRAGRQPADTVGK